MISRLLRQFLPALVTALAVALSLRCGPPAKAEGTNAAPDHFCFDTAGDMRQFVGPAPDGRKYFDGVCEAIQKLGPGDFMISPGDCDPPAPVRAMIDRYLGTNYVWYPVIGNHDADSAADMEWMRHWAEKAVPGLVRRGPAGAEDTIYSFDHGNSHFVIMNDYYDGHSDAVGKGDAADAMLKWMEDDLTANQKPLVWVTGHKPIQSMPDIDSGRMRHADDSLTTNAVHLERFLNLLREHHVRAYICGHTHDASVTQIKGVWQADSGHARGAGDPGAPSTFLRFRIEGGQSWADIYRADTNGANYHLRQSVELK